MNAYLAQPVICYWPEKFEAGPQAGIVTKVLPSGTVNVCVFLDYHNPMTRMFLNVPLLDECPANPPPSLKWVLAASPVPPCCREVTAEEVAKAETPAKAEKAKAKAAG